MPVSNLHVWLEEPIDWEAYREINLSLLDD
jgi:hypothetical protein